MGLGTFPCLCSQGIYWCRRLMGWSWCSWWLQVELAALPVNHSGSAVRKQLPVIWSLHSSEGSSIYPHVFAVLWAVDCSAQSPGALCRRACFGQTQPEWKRFFVLPWTQKILAFGTGTTNLCFDKICWSLGEFLPSPARNLCFLFEMSLVFPCVLPWFWSLFLPRLRLLFSEMFITQ